MSDHLLLRRIVTNGIKAISDNWTPGQTYGPVLHNLGLVQGCPAMQKFCRAVQQEGKQCLNHVVYAWHGSRFQNLASIFHNGFDPSRRSGQAKGPGEYFAAIGYPTTSDGYSRDNDYLILTAIIRSSRFKDHGSVHVVDNDRSGHSSHCLPLCAVKNPAKRGAQPREFTFTSHASVPWSFVR
ncbi:hypothetical protein P9112_003530 [Eukaryota sp. TZLM1-RC]